VIYLQLAGAVSNVQVDTFLGSTHTGNSECHDSIHSGSVTCNTNIFPGTVSYVKISIERISKDGFLTLSDNFWTVFILMYYIPVQASLSNSH